MPIWGYTELYLMFIRFSVMPTSHIVACVSRYISIIPNEIPVMSKLNRDQTPFISSIRLY